MKIYKIFTLIILILLTSCAVNQTASSNKKVDKIYYSSTGFALIYEDSFYKDKVVNKKINNNEILILHNNLKRNTPVLITNLSNSKSIKSKVHKKANYPKIFNVVISKKIAEILLLDIENPLVEVVEMKKNKKFIAKEGNTFDEEKNVADKAPVDEIKMNDLTVEKSNENDELKKKEKFIIVISDFYYKDSAISLKNDLLNKIPLKNIYVKKISNNKYRLFIGPFKNFNALKTTYISLNNLGFESLNIYNE